MIAVAARATQYSLPRVLVLPFVYLHQIMSFRKRYIDEFHEDMRLLGCLPPSLEPRATAHIPAMIDTIAQIIDNEHAYAVDGDVFFDIQTLPGYGRLSRHTQVDVLLRINISSPVKG